MVHNTTMKHRRGWEGAAPKSDVTARELVLRLSFFFFFFLFFHGFASTQLDSRRTGLIQPESGCIGQIKSYRPTTKTAKADQNRP